MKNIQDKQKNENTILLGKKRWFILGLFTLYSIANIIHTVQYAIIADVVVKYYNVSYDAVNWSAMIFMVVFVLFSFPGNYISDKLGLRATILLGITGTCLGSWIKVIAVNPERFWLALIGQFVLSLCQVFVLPVPPKVAAVWFGDKEISTACCIGVMATQHMPRTGLIRSLYWRELLVATNLILLFVLKTLACALANIIPTLVVPQGDVKIIESGLYINTLGYAVFSSMMIPVLFFSFTEKPSSIPSIAQLNIIENIENRSNYLKSVKNLLSDKSYVIFTISYGILIGCFYPYSVLANQIILLYYPDASVDVGIIGLAVLTAVVLGSLTNGILLDKFGKFKATIYAMYFLFFIMLVITGFLFTRGLIFLYITMIIAGFAFGNCLSNGFEVAIELTYPISEEISGGILTCSTQLFAILITLLFSYLFYTFNIYWANGSICLLVLIANLMLPLVKFSLRRQEVTKLESTKL